MIRLAVESDAEAIARIYSPAVTDHVTSFERIPPDTSEMVERMRTIGTQYPWLVREEDGVVAGYAYASPHRDRWAYQWSVDVCVYVDSTVHRRGTGRALYTSLFAVLVLQGYRNAYAGIALPNPASEGLHLAVGFKKVGTYYAVGYKFGAWHDVAWFERQLAEHVTNPPPPLSISSIVGDPVLMAAVSAFSVVSAFSSVGPGSCITGNHGDSRDSTWKPSPAERRTEARHGAPPAARSPQRELRQRRLLRSVASRSRAERTTRIVGTVGALHGKALGKVRKELPPGDEAAGSSTVDRAPLSTLIKI
jgi:phosphinothricin acetyltransferase